MKDFLIADAGTTKTEWAFFYEGKASPIRLKTEGINPAQMSIEQIKKTLLKVKNHFNLDRFDSIYYFGAGCATPLMVEKIRSAYSEIFKYRNINIGSDLKGAAIALLGNNKGLIGILGTGSSTGYFENGELLRQIPSLGFILGDEGSGTALGKRLLNAIYKKQLSKSIIEKFEQEYHLSLSVLIEEVYSKERPGAFIASFSPFLLKNKNDNSIRKMISEEFDCFFKKNVLPYGTEGREISLVGSIAYYYEDLVRESAKSNKIEIKEIIKEPMSALVRYYGLK